MIERHFYHISSRVALLLLVLLSAVNCQTETKLTGESAGNASKETPTTTTASTSSIPQPADLSPELAAAFDRTICPDYCWRGVMLGQTEEEVVAAIRGDPWTDKDASLEKDDYIEIRRTISNDSVEITWQVRPPTNPEAALINQVWLSSGHVESMRISLLEPFPFGALLDELGEPMFVSVNLNLSLGREPSWFTVYYPTARLAFRIEGIGGNPQLKRQNLVETAYFDLETGLDDFRCLQYIYPWVGLGGSGKYYTANNPELPQRTLPDDCSGPEETSP
jgi:hypothetical protein